jgi:hypothetical protein
MIGVMEGDCHRISEDCARFVKRHTMLLEVRDSFPFIPFEFHHGHLVLGVAGIMLRMCGTGHSGFRKPGALSPDYFVTDVSGRSHLIEPKVIGRSRSFRAQELGVIRQFLFAPMRL